MRIAAAAALLAVVFAGPALAKDKPVVKGKAGAARAAPAHPSLQQQAADGDVQAQAQLGMDLLNGGGGLRKAPAQAVPWLALAATNGNAQAARRLAEGFEQGWFGKRDLQAAASWWYRAGDLGDEEARQRFVTLYLGGDCDSIGGPAGVRWLESVARGGGGDAILALGRVLELGDGVAADPAKALAWYRRAAIAGDLEGQYRLGSLLLEEPGAWRLLFKDISREADNPDRDRLYASREAARQAAGNDRWVDITRPGMIEGEYWLGEAARRGHPLAALTLGEAYLGGRDLPFDMARAMRWLSAAALAGEPQAMKQLADLAASGQGLFAPDPIRAWVNYDLAAGLGLHEAEEPRDRLAKTMTQRQLNRSRQIVADLRGN